MTTLGKFSLFIGLTALLMATGCEKKKAPDKAPVEAAESTENEEADANGPGSLEARCFEGDPSACDALGH